jgi:RHS repeat-associated protein
VNGNRIGTWLNGSQQLWTVYDGSNPYMDFDGSGTLTERYLTDPNALSQFVGQVNSSGTPQWFLTDNINSIRQVVSTSGTSLDAITYNPYGGLVTQTNATNAPRFGYASGEQDSILGIYRFNGRWYNPTTGEWLSQDPLGLDPDTNSYRYVENDPINSIDPSGLQRQMVPRPTAGSAVPPPGFFDTPSVSPIGLPRNVYEGAVTKIGSLIVKAGTNAAVRLPIAGDWTANPRQSNTFELDRKVSNTLLMNLGLGGKDAELVKKQITDYLKSKGYKNITITEKVTVSYVIYNRVASEPGKTNLGRVFWTLEVRAYVTATSPSGRRESTYVRLGHAQNHYEDPDRYGAKDYPGPGAK